ncbi:MAG: hypothetical protein V1847_01465, partial [Candidatus Diapherotrites archaeon]
MISAIEQLQKLNEKQRTLSRNARETSWKTLSPQGMNAALQESVEGFRELKNGIAHLGTLLEMQKVSMDSETRENSISELLNVLHRNASFEREKTISPREPFFAHAEKHSELYDSLQEKVLNELDNVEHFLKRAEMKIREKGFAKEGAREVDSAEKSQALAAIQRQLVKQTDEEEKQEMETEWLELTRKVEQEVEEAVHANRELQVEKSIFSEKAAQAEQLWRAHVQKT